MERPVRVRVICKTAIDGLCLDRYIFIALYVVKKATKMFNADRPTKSLKSRNDRYCSFSAHKEKNPDRAAQCRSK